jgi:hypothetical protein
MLACVSTTVGDFLRADWFFSFIYSILLQTDDKPIPPAEICRSICQVFSSSAVHSWPSPSSSTSDEHLAAACPRRVFAEWRALLRCASTAGLPADDAAAAAASVRRFLADCVSL